MELNERYYARFGLEYNPFIKNNSTKHYYESSDLKEAKYKLDYLFKTKGIGVITGNPGMGKTTTIRKYLSELNRALYKPIYICMTTLNDNDSYIKILTNEEAKELIRDWEIYAKKHPEALPNYDLYKL